MRQRDISNYQFIFAALVVAILAPALIAEVLYVDSSNGDDTNPGTKDKPVRTIARAAVIVNESNEPGPTTIKIAPGFYAVTEAIIIENAREYTKEKRLIIESTLLPDEPQWKPALMPVIISVEEPHRSNAVNQITETYSIKVKINHVTIQGLKFLGNPSLNNMHACVERIGKKLDDLLIKQCMFIGDRNGADIYAATLATGDRFVVEHCIFKGCGASAVWWDGFDEIGGRGCAMRYCIIDGTYMSGPCTCQTAEDFEFHNNIVTNSKYFWIRKPGDKQKYRIRNCAIANNTYWSGYGVASGPTGETEDDIIFKEQDVVKSGEVIFEKDEQSKHYLHVVPGAVGSNLGAGLFTESVRGVKTKEQGYRKETYAYKEVEGHKILADVYLPEGGGIRPVLIYLHGGGFIFGNRTGCRKPLRDKLLEAGYVVVSIDYRLAPETKLEEIVEDVKDACKWVRQEGPELFNINPSRIAVGGGSAGGVLALIAGYTVEPKPQALVIVSTPAGEAKDAKMWKGDRSLIKKGTPYDVVSDKIVTDGGYTRRMELWRWLAQNRLSLSEVLGFDPESDMERFKRLIPLENITNDYPTTLIVHARTDRLVPLSHAEKLANALKAKEIEHELFVVPDGHSSEIIWNYPEAVEKIVSFLDIYLK